MTRDILKNNLIMGGLIKLNDESIAIRNRQINDGYRIHTCNDYLNSLEIISIASQGIQENLKLMTKIYLKYPNHTHKRFRPLIEQLNEIINRLGFVPTDWSLQLCCCNKLNELKSFKAKNFFEKINKEFKIQNIYLEVYPSYNYNLIDIINLNKQVKINFGLIGYQNLLNRVFTNRDLNFLSKNNIKTCFMGFLGKGKQNQYYFRSMHNIKNDFIEANILYFLSNVEIHKNIDGLTQVSSLNQYEDLKKRLFLINKTLENKTIKNFMEFENNFNKNYFLNYDQYRENFKLINYFKNPILIIAKLKNFILWNIKSIKFRRNFWL